MIDLRGAAFVSPIDSAKCFSPLRPPCRRSLILSFGARVLFTIRDALCSLGLNANTDMRFNGSVWPPLIHMCFMRFGLHPLP